jgi:hypothetical protein
MKRYLVLAIVVFGVATATHAEIVTGPFSGKLTRVDGMPFGIQAVPFETIISGAWRYGKLAENSFSKLSTSNDVA